MNSLLIHLSGHLSAEMGSELYLKVKHLSQAPCLFCVGVSGLTSIDEVGVEFLRKISKRLHETASKLAISGLTKEISAQFLSLDILNLFPIFSNLTEAKQFLELHIIPTEAANENNLIKQATGIPKTPSNTNDTNFFACPSCGQNLRFNLVGDYSCPACAIKFGINKRGWISTYEKLL